MLLSRYWWNHWCNKKQICSIAEKIIFVDHPNEEDMVMIRETLELLQIKSLSYHMFIKISTRNLSMISMTFATKLVEYFIENDDFDNIVQSLEIKISSSHQKETKRSSNLSLKISMTSIIIHLFITSFTLYPKKDFRRSFQS